MLPFTRVSKFSKYFHFVATQPKYVYIMKILSAYNKQEERLLEEQSWSNEDE